MSTRPLRVALDATPLMRTGLTGIGVYVAHLVRALDAMPSLSVTPYWRLSRAGRSRLVAAHIGRRGVPYVAGITELGHDVVHGTDFRIPRRYRIPTVVTVHDLAVFEPALLEPAFAAHGRERLSRTLVNDAPDRVIAISEFTRRRLLEEFPSLAGRVRVVPMGVSPPSSGGPGAPPPTTRPYILFLGSIELRKNVDGLIDAYDELRGSGEDIDLVLAGGDGHGAEVIRERIRRSPWRADIHRLGFVSDATRAGLYAAAEAFVFPSRYEGFGLPILESMAAGCPVVTSDIGAMAEVAGTAAELVAHDRPEAIAAGVRRVLHDSAHRDRLIALGHARAGEFTWERCAAATAKLYGEMRSE